MEAVQVLLVAVITALTDSTAKPVTHSFSFENLTISSVINDLTLYISQTGFVDSRNWNYYHFTPGSQNNLIVTVTQASDSADCDLYVKESQNPTTLNYDFRDIGYNTTMIINVANPGDSTWYFGVYGYRPCDYSIKVDLSGLNTS
jgi:hypothetical protein